MRQISPTKRRLLMGGFVLVLLPLAQGSAAIPPDPAFRVPIDKWPADSFEIVGGGRYSTLREIPDVPGLADSGKMNAGVGSLGTTADLSIYVDPDPKRQGPPRTWADAGFYYKGLAAGQVLPILGAMYKVTGVGRGVDKAVKFSRVADGALLKEIGVAPGSVAIPLHDSVQFMFSADSSPPWDKSFVSVKAITAGNSKDKPSVAHISLNNKEHDEPDYPAKERDVKQGDVVGLVWGCKLRVVKIVPPDEKRKIAGWVEFAPSPELCGQMFHQLFSDADVGSDPAFEKLMVDNRVRKGLLAPRRMREFVTSRKDLYRITGSIQLEARFADGWAMFIWTFDPDFSSDKADGVANARAQLTAAGFREAKQLAVPYLQKQAERESHVLPASPLVFAADHSDTVENVFVSTPEQPFGGNVHLYRQTTMWAVLRKWEGEPPTFRQLLDACPLLKSPYPVAALDEYMNRMPVFSYETGFRHDPVLAGWHVEVPGKFRPELEALFGGLGFKQFGHPTHSRLLHDPKATEQQDWQRESDASFVSITPFGDKIKVGYQGPQPPK